VTRSNKVPTILIADDDRDYYLLAKEALEKNTSPCDIRYVEDGEELIAYLTHQGKYQAAGSAPAPAMILLDLNMPRKSGYEALKEIRANEAFKLVPIVMLTISRDLKDIKRCYEAGAHSFITKPYEVSELDKTFHTLKEYWLKTVALPPN
jgi:CheY-like chemotaxis protein